MGRSDWEGALFFLLVDVLRVAEKDWVMVGSGRLRSIVDAALTGSDLGRRGSVSSKGLGELGSSKGLVCDDVSSTSPLNGFIGFTSSSNGFREAVFFWYDVDVVIDLGFIRSKVMPEGDILDCYSNLQAHMSHWQ